MDSRTTLNDAISGDRAEQLASDLGHQKSQIAIRAVVESYVDSTAFANKVKEIQKEALEADPARNKLKDWVLDLIRTEMNTQSTKKTEKKWGMIIGVGGLVVGVFGIAVAIVAVVLNRG